MSALSHRNAWAFERRTAQLRAAVEAERGSLYLREDRLASEIARTLRPWRDLDLAERLLIAEHGNRLVVTLALSYERARRRAFTNQEIDATPGVEAAELRTCPLERGLAATPFTSVGVRDGHDEHPCVALPGSLAFKRTELGPVDADRPTPFPTRQRGAADARPSQSHQQRETSEAGALSNS